MTAFPVQYEFSGSGTKEKTYTLQPFDVPAGTTRVEVTYTWTPVKDNVIDLGLWDQHGYRSVAGFRGWSGSRQGRLDKSQPPVYVQADSAERGYLPGPVEPGTWHVELGIAAVRPEAPPQWHVEVRCLADAVGSPALPRRVNPAYVARAEAKCYHGDFHMHAKHSNPAGPDWDDFIRYAGDARLDFLPVTEYVTNCHWDELGPVQDRHPDVLIWPGREIITYFGHAIALGETPSTIEYRHGFEDVSLADVQRDTVRDGALFGIAHPTFGPPYFKPNQCRGCRFTLSEEIDWDAVDTIEVVTGSARRPDAPAPNPCVETAIMMWHGLLNHGHRVTAVSGSDNKPGPGLGATSTAVHAQELSRPALLEAIRAGHAFVQGLGVRRSPSLEVKAVTEDGQEGIFGDTLVASRATMTVTAVGGKGQRLRILRNGAEVTALGITADSFTHTFTAERAPTEGPLGTFWGIETLDDVGVRTTIANPIFLAGREHSPVPET